MDLAHIAISTADLDGAVKWYKQFFGFAEIKRFEKQEFEIKGALLSNGSITIELLLPYKLDKNPTRPSTLAEALRAQGLNHISLNVDDLKDLFLRMRDNGECLITEIVSGRFFFCCDPDGTLIEIRQK
ncbi:MAG: VOC family protein [Spirochaetales bacterium]|nr:VOC family protein [Spirochaetales bacterium]